MNDIVLKNIKRILDEGRKCPYMMRDDNFDIYCSTFVDCPCGFQGEFSTDRNKVTFRECKKEYNEL